MIIEDKFVIDAPLEDAWEFLLDIPRVSHCVPGAERIEPLDDGRYKGNLVIKVGPISANFAGEVQLLNLDPPNRLNATARARDRATASIASIDFSAALTPTGTQETEVEFTVDVTIRGRLGQFGQGVMRETAKQLTQVFAGCVQSHLAQQNSNQEAANSTADSHATDTSTYPEEAAHASQLTPKTPSLIAIFFRSIVNSFRNWLRSLRAS